MGDSYGPLASPETEELREDLTLGLAGMAFYEQEDYANAAYRLARVQEGKRCRLH